MNSTLESRIIEANGGRESFRWIEHVEQLDAMHEARKPYEAERAELDATIRSLELKLATARQRREWLDALEAVAAGFAEIRFRPLGRTGSALFVYLRDPSSPTRVSLITSAPDDEQHNREARAASPTGTIYASASL